MSRYWGRYRLVLVTNLRDFVLVGADASGDPAKLETFRLAENADDFWSKLEKPPAFARDVGAGLGEYLARSLAHRAALAEPKDLAWLLASYARDGLARVEAAGDAPPLVTVRSALERSDGSATASPPAPVRLTLAEGAPFAMTVPLSVQGGAASPSSASLLAGSTEGPVFTVSPSAPGQPTRVTAASLPIPRGFWGITLAAPELVLFGTWTAAGVCDRTPQVRDELVRVTEAASCEAVTDGDLAGIQSLDLTRSAITYLREGDFAGLSALEELWLTYNDLTSLPEGVFAGLANLQTLSLQENDLTSLPAGVLAGLVNLQGLRLHHNALTSLPEGVFAGFANLQELVLYWNDLTSLPTGVFAGLASLKYLWLRNNPGSPFELALELERSDGAVTASAPASVRLKLAEGAPFTMTVPLSVQGGAASSSSASLPVGRTEGPVFTVTPSVPGQPTRVTAARLPAIPSGFDGITLAAPAGLVLFATTGSVREIFRDDFDDAGSLSDWVLDGAEAEVADGVLRLANAESDRWGIAEHVLSTPVTFWEIRARMGRASVHSMRTALVFVPSNPGDLNFRAYRLEIGSRILRLAEGDEAVNYAFSAYFQPEGGELGWYYFTDGDYFGISEAINDGAGEFTEITVRMQDGTFAALAGAETLFSVDVGQTYFNSSLPEIEAVHLWSVDDAAANPGLVDWIEINGLQIGGSTNGDRDDSYWRTVLPERTMSGGVAREIRAEVRPTGKCPPIRR